jgi:ribosome-binding factor A
MPRLTPSSSKPPSQRQLRVAELIRHAVAEALTRGEIIDPVIETHVITVPEVRMSPDLKVATVFVMPLGGRDGQPVIKALAQNAKFLRGLIARRVTTKFVPDLRFRLDESFEYAGKIDTLLRRPEVSRDLDAPLPDINDTKPAGDDQP